MNALARICAKLPPSQWIQLKIGRLLEVGAGRNKAPIGCKKHTIVVIVPRIACGLSSDDQAPSSTTISTDAAIVRAHVKTINIRCHCNLSLNGLINNKKKTIYIEWTNFGAILTANHWSLPHNWLPTHVCLKYRANKMPSDALPTQAVIMNAACNRKNSFEAPAIDEISAKCIGLPDASRPISW